MVPRRVNEAATVHALSLHSLVTRRVNEASTAHTPSLIRTASIQELPLGICSFSFRFLQDLRFYWERKFLVLIEAPRNQCFDVSIF